MQSSLHIRDHYDWARKSLMLEPRGHDMMAGAILLPPTSTEADARVVFMDTGGYLSMCGHGAIGLVTVAIEHNLVTPAFPGRFRLETPAGIVELRYRCEGYSVKDVTIQIVPSFLYAQGLSIDTPSLGRISVDVAYGGNFCAIVEPQLNVLPVRELDQHFMLSMSEEIRQALDEQLQPVHPHDPSIQGVKQIMWTGPAKNPEADFMNAVCYGLRSLDRSPCGSGSAARMAQLHALGRLQIGSSFVHESIIGSLYHCMIESTTTVDKFPAVVTSVRGNAEVIAESRIFVDEQDPFAYGFSVK
jgi:4-hydroxyproline epimerase